ncbi:MAG: tryptophan-rich sensory protein [Myxococcota bacterium]
MNPRLSAGLNALLVVAVVAWNYWTAAVGLNGKTVGGMSRIYDTLFTPAAYAFSIWGLIFLLQGAHAVHQLRAAFRGDEALFNALGPWLLITNVLNMLWTFVWLSEWTATSVAVLFAMNVCLFIAVRRLEEARTYDSPGRRLLEWWPFTIYAGWVAVAVLANLSAYLSKQGWVNGESEGWAIGMIAVAMAYNLFLLARRQLVTHAWVAVWACGAIAVRQWNGSTTVAWSATKAGALVAVCCAVVLYRTNRSERKTSAP